MINVASLIISTMKKEIFNESNEKNSAARIVLGELKTKQKDIREEITTQIQYNILKKLKAAREESIEIYTNANKLDLANKEKLELEVINYLMTELEKDLPKLMTESEIRETMQKVISENTNINMGLLMKPFKEITNVDKKLVSTIAREYLK